MAKTIPKKKNGAKVKKKSEIQKQLAERRARASELERYSDMILDVNDAQISEAVSRMVESLWAMNGRSVNDDALNSILSAEYRYIAVRMLVACAKWDVRIGNFKLPKGLCADCGVKVKKGKKHG